MKAPKLVSTTPWEPTMELRRNKGVLQQRHTRRVRWIRYDWPRAEGKATYVRGQESRWIDVEEVA